MPPAASATWRARWSRSCFNCVDFLRAQLSAQGRNVVLPSIQQLRLRTLPEPILEHRITAVLRGNPGRLRRFDDRLSLRLLHDAIGPRHDDQWHRPDRRDRLRLNVQIRSDDRAACHRPHHTTWPTAGDDSTSRRVRETVAATPGPARERARRSMFDRNSPTAVSWPWTCFDSCSVRQIRKTDKVSSTTHTLRQDCLLHFRGSLVYASESMSVHATVDGGGVQVDLDPTPATSARIARDTLLDDDRLAGASIAGFLAGFFMLFRYRDSLSPRPRHHPSRTLRDRHPRRLHSLCRAFRRLVLASDRPFERQGHWIGRLCRADNVLPAPLHTRRPV